MTTRNNSGSNDGTGGGVSSSTSSLRSNLDRRFQQSEITSTARFRIPAGDNDSSSDGHQGPPPPPSSNFPVVGAPADDQKHGDALNYALLIILYTIQGIPMGLSASIPFLIQQKAKQLAAEAAVAAATAAGAAGAAAASAAAGSLSAPGAATAAAAAKLSFNANAIFALCSWPFSLKLLWAPIVDACFVRAFGRRKTWLVPVQAAAGALMVMGAPFIQQQFEPSQHGQLNVTG